MKVNDIDDAGSGWRGGGGVGSRINNWATTRRRPTMNNNSQEINNLIMATVIRQHSGYIAGNEGHIVDGKRFAPANGGEVSRFTSTKAT